MAARRKKIIPTMGKKRTKAEIAERKRVLADALRVYLT